MALQQSGPVQMPVILFDNDDDRRKGWLFCTEALKRGVYLHATHTMFLSAAHADADIDRTLAATDEAMPKSPGSSDRSGMTAKLAFLHDPPLDRLNLEQVDGQSRTDRVYRQMRDRLMRGILRPHQRLRINELSQAFGTSETPVREAIFQLIRDGAVEAKTHSYIRVRKLSVAEYLELREIRLLLEPLAADGRWKT